MADIFNERLIECVRNYPYLYDAKHSPHKDTRKKENAWKDIALQLVHSCTGKLHFGLLELSFCDQAKL